MRKVSIQDFNDLQSTVRILNEKMNRIVPLDRETIARLDGRIKRLEKAIGNPGRMIGSKEAAAYLGISASRLYSLAKLNLLPFHRLNRKMLFDKQCLDEWLSHHGKQ